MASRTLGKLSNGKCFYCKCPTYKSGSPEAIANPKQKSTRDHYIPGIWGDEAKAAANMVNACAYCNNVKLHYPADLFMFFLKSYIGTARFNHQEFQKFVFGCAQLGFTVAHREASARMSPVCEAEPVRTTKPLPATPATPATNGRYTLRDLRRHR